MAYFPFVAILFFVAFIFYKLVFKKKLQCFPSPIVYYVAKNAGHYVKLQISETSKSGLKLIRKIHGCSPINLNVGAVEKLFVFSRGALYISLDCFAKIKNPIVIGGESVFDSLTEKDFDMILPKLDLIESTSSLMISFSNCSIPQKFFESFSPLFIDSLEFRNSFVVENNFDMLYSVLKEMNNLEILRLTWQNGISSFEALTEIQKEKKLQHLSIREISELISPNAIKKVFLNCVDKNGSMSLDFCIPLPDNYQNTVMELFSADINGRKAGFSKYGEFGYFRVYLLNGQMN